MAVKTCAAPDCTKEARGRRYCHMHAGRLRRHGTLDIDGYALDFESKMERYVVPTGFCWEWVGMTAGKPPFLYGRVADGGERYQAHRWVYERMVGPIPDGHELDHLCRNPLCVNPDHLEPLSPAENKRRSEATHDRRIFCPKGHDLRLPNARGHGRTCRTCELDYFRAYNATRR